MRFSSSSTVPVRERPLLLVSGYAIFLLAVFENLVYLSYSLVSGTVTLRELVVKATEKDTRPAEVEREKALEDRASNPKNALSGSTVDEKDQWLSAVRGFCRAIVSRDVDLVSRALKASPSLAKTRHDGRWQPLHAAVLSGSVDIVRLVLAQPGVDASAVDRSNAESASSETRLAELGACPSDAKGATPLHYACMVGSMQIIEALLNAGADFDAFDINRRKPVEYFDVRVPAHIDAMAAFRILYEKWNRRKDFYADAASLSVDDLADMIKDNELDRFEVCIKKNPGLADNFTCYGFSLLHLTVIRRRISILSLLLSLAPNAVNKVDARNDASSETANASFAPPIFPHARVKAATPLHYACLVGDLEAARLLMEAGADWKVKDWKKRTPEALIYVDGDEGQLVREEFRRLKGVEEARRRREKEEEERLMREKEEEERLAREKEESRRLMEKEKEAEANKRDAEDMPMMDPESSEDTPSKTSDSKPRSDKSKDKPVEKPKEALRPLEVVLGEKLIGQRGPIRSVANAIRLREAGWVDPDRPLVLLFLGSSGVGKTELAKQVALHLHGKDGLASDKGTAVQGLEENFAFVRIDMSEYQQAHTVSNLMGSPKGYVGYDDEGFLSRRLRKNPRAIVLLDEIEKAHPDVLTVFLQLFDDGRITDSKRGVIYCKHAIFILTSNLASDEIKARAPALRTLVAETEEQGRLGEYLRVVSLFTRSVHPVLKKALKRDEFLGRINQMVVFLPLSAEEIGSVVERELQMWRTRAEEKHGIRLSWADEVVKKLASAYDINYGARSVANETQRIAVQLIADAHIQGRLLKGWHAYLTTDEFGDVVLKTGDSKDIGEAVDLSFPEGFYINSLWCAPVAE